jgi:hypothetical protein
MLNRTFQNPGRVHRALIPKRHNVALFIAALPRTLTMEREKPTNRPLEKQELDGGSWPVTVRPHRMRRLVAEDMQREQRTT